MTTLTETTKEALTKDELISFYKDIAQQQSDNYTTLITVLIGLTAVLVGSTWLWNFLIAKNQIRNEVNRLYNRSNDNLRKEFETIVENRFHQLEKTIEKKLKESEANLARLYAFNCADQNLYCTSISWWIRALKLYHETENHRFLRVSVEQIINILNHQPEWFSDMPDTFDLVVAVQEIELVIPELLGDERKQIVTAFKTRIKESNHTT